MSRCVLKIVYELTTNHRIKKGQEKLRGILKDLQLASVFVQCVLDVYVFLSSYLKTTNVVYISKPTVRDKTVKQPITKSLLKKLPQLTLLFRNDADAMRFTPDGT